MLRSCAVVVWMACLLATAWGRYLKEDDYGMIPMQDVKTEAVTETQPIENSGAGSQQVQQMGYAYGNQQQTTTSSELPPTSAPTQMLDIPMPSDNNYNQYSGYGSGYDEVYNSGSSGEESGSDVSGEESGSDVSGEESGSDASGEESGSDASGEESGSGLIPENEEGSGEGSGSFSPSDCPRLSNGNYPLSACSTQFLSCSNGLPFIMDCPEQLVYNWDVDQCDWPHNLNCTDEGDNSGEGSGDFHGPSDCPNLADGNYAMSACGHQFLTCSNGLPHVMDCPANLVYNAEFNMCDWPYNVVGCEGSGGEITSGEPLPEESGSGAASGEESGEFSGEESSGEESGLAPTEPMILPLPPVEQPTTTTRPVTTSTAQIIQESTTESSGLEPLPSTSTAEPETSGIEETTPLAEGSSTEAEAELSGEEGSAEMLGESQSTTTAIPSTSTIPAVTDEAELSGEEGSAEETEEGQQTTTDTGVESDTLCSSDGVFATESCSPNFHHCINGKLFDLSCNPGQLFSWARELCLPVTEFPECDLH